MKRDRGEYRPIYEVLLDGPDWEKLPADARLVFLALKLKCGAFGIKVVSGLVGSLGQWTGLSARRVEDATRVLTKKQWIEREGSVVWVVRGLEFEPTLDAHNANHRKYLARTLDALPSLPIVDRFRERYSEWVSKGIPHPLPDGIPHPLPITTPSPSTTPTTTPPAREAVADAFWTDARTVAFLDSLANDTKRLAWRAILGKWRQGEGWSGERPADDVLAAALAGALTASDAGPLTERFVAACVRRQMRGDPPAVTPVTGDAPSARLKRMERAS